MPLIDKLKEAQMQARREKNQSTLSVLQMALSQIKNEQIHAMKKELSDDEVILVLHKFVKQMKDALSDFQKAGRKDLIDQTVQEISIVSAYLPTELSEDEVREIAKSVIASLAPVQPSDFGKVMGKVMNEVKGRANGSVVQLVVKQLLV